MNYLPKAQDDASVSVRGKAGTLQTNLIGTDSKLVAAKETPIIGHYGARLICQSVAECNRRLRYHGAAAVAYGPVKSRSNSRSLSGSLSRAEQQGKRDGNPDNNMTHANQAARPNHLGSPIPINSGRTKKIVLIELQGRSYAAQ